MSTKRGKYGNPAKRRPVLYGDLLKGAQPTGIANPSTLGGSMTGDLGDSRARDAVIIDMTDVVLLEGVHVSTVVVGRQGTLAEEATYLQLSGRVNKTTRQVQVGFMCPTDGVAGIVTELLAIAERAGAEMLDDITRRLTELHQGKHVDLHWLRAAIDNAIELQAETGA